MTKTLCDFTFDGHTYCVVAEIDAQANVKSIAHLAHGKGPRAQDVADLADMLGALMRPNTPFSEIRDMPLGPLGIALMAGVERSVETVARVHRQASRMRGEC